VHANDGVQLWIDQQLLIDDFSRVDDEVKGKVLVSEEINLAAGQFVPLKANYLEVESLAFATLLFRMVGDSEDTVVPASSLYHIQEKVPVSGSEYFIHSFNTPRQPTELRQADASTYSIDTVSLLWLAPLDTGCDQITNYEIEARIGAEWTQVGTSTGESFGDADLSTQPGTLTELRVVPVSNKGRGVASEAVLLMAASLPGPSPLISVTEYAATSL
jgi:hypothetical protein